MGTLNATIFYWINIVIFFLVMKFGMFKNNADGGGGEAAATYGAACSIDSFSFQLFQIKFDQNRLTKFKNFHFLLYISKNRLK